MLNNCHVCWRAVNRRARKDRGTFALRCHPKPALGDGDIPLHRPFPLCLCHCSPLSRSERDPQKSLSLRISRLRAGLPRDPRDAWTWACDIGPVWAWRGVFLFFSLLFFLNFILIISPKSLPSAETISRLHVFIFFFTFPYSLLIIPLSDVWISDCISWDWWIFCTIYFFVVVFWGKQRD